MRQYWLRVESMVFSVLVNSLLIISRHSLGVKEETNEWKWICQEFKLTRLKSQEYSIHCIYFGMENASLVYIEEIKLHITLLVWLETCWCFVSQARSDVDHQWSLRSSSKQLDRSWRNLPAITLSNIDGEAELTTQENWSPDFHYARRDGMKSNIDRPNK